MPHAEMLNLIPLYLFIRRKLLLSQKKKKQIFELISDLAQSSDKLLLLGICSIT